VEAVAETHTFQSFGEDLYVYEATLRNIEIMGEAVKNLPDELKSAYPEVEWRSIGRTRDILAHVYFGIKDAIIWEIVTSKARELTIHAEAILLTLD
jgi:uncharacterized protein with HEPN domain